MPQAGNAFLLPGVYRRPPPFPSSPLRAANISAAVI